MTKDTEEFSQFTDAVACRGPVLEVTTCYLQGKYGVENRIMSVNKDNSHSWVRISHGLNKLVTDLNNNEQETSEMYIEDYALRLKASDFASRSKAKAKPQKRDLVSSSTRSVNTIPPIQQNLLEKLLRENNGYEVQQAEQNMHNKYTNDDADIMHLHLDGRVAYHNMH